MLSEVPKARRAWTTAMQAIATIQPIRPNMSTSSATLFIVKRYTRLREQGTSLQPKAEPTR
jgi:hypothetical protein